MPPIVRALPALVLAAVLALAPGAAFAVPPMDLQEQITDEAGVLDESVVQSALQDLRSETGVQLFVAFVDSFDGRSGDEWARETAEMSRLGTDDYLLAVAVQDRTFGYGTAPGGLIDREQADAVARERIEPRLAADDWTGAVVAAAEGYEEVLSGGGLGAGAVPGGGGLGSLLAFLLPVLLLGGGAIALGAVLLSRRRKQQHAQAEPQGPSSEELWAEANRLLVQTDDAVRSSEQELGFAVAEFGEEPTASFRDALQRARAALSRGFAVRQQLEDDVPETEPQRRQLLSEVIDLCTSANEALDAEADRFNELRDLLSTAPQRLDQVLAEADAWQGRLPQAEAELADLRQRYAPSALVSVDRNVTEAAARIEFARDAARDGREALGSSETRAEAAVALQAAQEALDHARRLITAVSRAGSDLADAVARLPSAIADVRADLARAHAEGAPQEAIAAAAEAVAGAERNQASDPLGSLHRVVEADAALDRSRTVAREEREARERAARALDQAMAAAWAEIQTVEDFIGTRRGAVGSEARTRLAEARRRFDTAHQLRGEDPVAALEEARTADRLAEEAGRLARSDVDSWYDQGGPGGFGGFGAPPRGRSSDASGMLAGILIGHVLGGAGRGGGGGFGGGGFGGGFGGGGFGGGGGGFGGGRF